MSGDANALKHRDNSIDRIISWMPIKLFLSQQLHAGSRNAGSYPEEEKGTMYSRGKFSFEVDWSGTRSLKATVLQSGKLAHVAAHLAT